ncbi:hypothetical protein SRABI96_04908 [Peribacillus sp. Bi96]|uniref:hypothetical protein n=1 Tax=Peribacillus sp. Bi96 TaxID=2884273 RepID=UPI001D9C9BE5|nr:hypothetical protein [Peribacillus sp. Bi96]CAH0309058.1 hypothetical protein SRABI96_04908 [Peribacillus sp. Bi96]
MSIVEWNTALTDVLSGSVVLIIGAVGGGVFGFFRGKKQSAVAIERKNNIYQPLLDELEPMGNFELNVLINKKTPILVEVVTNEYKYGMSTELQEKCNYLYSQIEQFNRIKLVSIANDKIVEIFKNGYEELYGSVIDGVSYHSDKAGNEWEDEHLTIPVELIQRGNFDKLIVNLLNTEGMYDYEVRVDDISEPIYGDLVNIFNSTLNVSINGVNHPLPLLKKELGMSPAEYMALNYDFFNIYNTDTQKLRKDELREEIILKSQEVIQDLKDVIRRIVLIYEVEEI